MRARAPVQSLALVAVGAATGLVTAGLAAAAGLGAAGTAAALMAPIAVLFAVRAPEGLAGFGIAILVADSVSYWTGIDLRYADEAGLPLLAVTALTVHRRRLRVPRLGVPELGLATLVAAGIASSLANDVPAATWVTGLVLLAKAIGFFYVVWLLGLDIDEVQRVGLPILVAGLGIGVVGLVQAIAPDWAATALRLPPTGQPRGGIEVVGSIFTHPALFGWLTAFLSLFLYARFAILRDRLALALGLAANVGTLLSGRRSPIVGVVAALLVGAARHVTAGGRLGPAWAAVAAAVVAVLLASVPVLGDFYAETLEAYGAPPGAMAELFSEQPDPIVVAELHPRVALTVGSIAVAGDHLPLGAGIGRFGSHLSRQSYSPVYSQYGLHRTYGLREANPRAVTDTFWPMILGETGVLGLAGALVFFGGLAVRLWRTAGRDAPPGVRAFTLGAGLVFVEATVRSLISQAFIAPPIAYVVLGAAGLALGLDPGHLRGPRAPENEYSVDRGTPLASNHGGPRSTPPDRREVRDG